MLVVFSKKQVEIAITCYFYQVNTSHSYINQIQQHSRSCMTNSVDHDLDSHCLQGNLNIGSES